MLKDLMLNQEMTQMIRWVGNLDAQNRGNPANGWEGTGSSYSVPAVAGADRQGAQLAAHCVYTVWTTGSAS